MLPKKLAFVDIETTGMRLRYDRVIEVGILRVEDEEVTRTYQTLINPGGYISEQIFNLTGISSQMLDNAPYFRTIKDELLEVLDDCYFVAHNVRFDYSFLKQEFLRFGINFSPKHFCTVKLSKTLYPNFAHHNLDSLIERFNIQCENRHRAFDDAKVIFDFYQIVKDQFDPEKLNLALTQALKRPTRPINIPTQILDELPETPGVYIFYGENDHPLYIGKSVNIRDRVLSHFASDHSSSTEMKISQQIQRIETITTPGELGALIKESSLIKTMQPLYNRRLRSIRKLIVVKKEINEDGYQVAKIETLEQIEVAELSQIIGIFRSKKQAREYLIKMCKQFGLCEKLLFLEKTTGGCFSYRLGKCKGACKKQESAQFYNLRFIVAFSTHEFATWPFAGPVYIKEGQSKGEAFLIDQWCLLGIFNTKGDIPKLLDQEYLFDLDTYKIIHSYVRNPKNQRNIEIVVGQKAENSLNYSITEPQL